CVSCGKTVGCYLLRSFIERNPKCKERYVEDRDFYVAPNENTSTLYKWLLYKDMLDESFIYKFNKTVARLQSSGVYEYEVRKALKPKGFGPDIHEKPKSDSDLRFISLTDLKGTFIILAIGLTSAIFSLFTELIKVAIDYAYKTTVTCAGAVGTVSDFKDNLRKLDGYGVDDFIIRVYPNTQLPDEPFTDTTEIKRIIIQNSPKLEGFGSKGGKGFFTNLGKSLKGLVIDNNPGIRSDEWVRIAPELGAGHPLAIQDQLIQNQKASDPYATTTSPSPITSIPITTTTEKSGATGGHNHSLVIAMASIGNILLVRWYQSILKAVPLFAF
ncbi:unnamed protein product, partial [Oppiella nova]